jgi:hypothetical protein
MKTSAVQKTIWSKDWQQVLTLSHGSGYWDDQMAFAVQEIVKAPEVGYPKDAGSQKLCYSAPMMIVNPSYKYSKTYHPTVIVSVNNKLVITAYPTTSPNCGISERADE